MYRTLASIVASTSRHGIKSTTAYLLGASQHQLRQHSAEERAAAQEVKEALRRASQDTSEASLMGRLHFTAGALVAWWAYSTWREDQREHEWRERTQRHQHKMEADALELGGLAMLAKLKADGLPTSKRLTGKMGGQVEQLKTPSTSELARMAWWRQADRRAREKRGEHGVQGGVLKEQRCACGPTTEAID